MNVLCIENVQNVLCIENVHIQRIMPVILLEDWLSDFELGVKVSSQC